MRTYYDDGFVKIFQGNNLDVLKELPEESVQCIVTSPPYWGLRKYDGEQGRVWGGNADCEHEWGELLPEHHPGQVEQTKWKNAEAAGKGQTAKSGQYCQLCGAWRGAYGLEPTPQMYVEHTVEILREIRRVLRKDGVCFWNVGDSYAGSGEGSGGNLKGNEHGQHTNMKGIRPKIRLNILKPKDLCLIPQRVSIAVQDDGWYVRSIIIWSKKNPMPESVKDRPTTSHEYILMLTKSKDYYWDQEAVREENSPTSDKWGKSVPSKTAKAQGNGKHGVDSFLTKEIPRDQIIDKYYNNGRNIRSVWEFSTEPYPDAHFAVFPSELPKRCIMAASKEGDIILDPFAGSGTTGMVAKQLNRKSILIDISETYCKLEVKRVSSISLPMPL